MNESQADFWVEDASRALGDTRPPPRGAAQPGITPARFDVARIDDVAPLDDQIGADPKRGWPAPLDGFFTSTLGRNCFVLLDAAQGDGLTELLDGSGLEHACLYQGVALHELGQVAPWLVRLEPGNMFARLLLTKGRRAGALWGRFRGLYLRSDASLDDLRAHLRRRQRVQDAAGKAFYLRFWEPQLIAELARMHGDSAQILAGLCDGRAVQIAALAGDLGEGHFVIINRAEDAPPPPANANGAVRGRPDLALPAVMRAVRASAQTSCEDAVTDGLVGAIPTHLQALGASREDLERLVAQVAADARGFGVIGRAAIGKLASASAFLGYRMLYDPRLGDIIARWLPARAPQSDLFAVTRMMDAIVDWRQATGLTGSLSGPLAAVAAQPDATPPRTITANMSPEAMQRWSEIIRDEARRAGLRHPAAIAAHAAVAWVCGPFFLTDPLQARLAARFAPDPDPCPGLLAEARLRDTDGGTHAV